MTRRTPMVGIRIIIDRGSIWLLIQWVLSRRGGKSTRTTITTATATTITTITTVAIGITSRQCILYFFITIT